jgi:hypothetical protein
MYDNEMVVTKKQALSNPLCQSLGSLFSQRETRTLEDAGWQWGFKLTTEYVWDAFVILSLLRDHQGHQHHLVVPILAFKKTAIKLPCKSATCISFERVSQRSTTGVENVHVYTVNLMQTGQRSLVSFSHEGSDLG